MTSTPDKPVPLAAHHRGSRDRWRGPAQAVLRQYRQPDRAQKLQRRQIDAKIGEAP